MKIFVLLLLLFTLTVTAYSQRPKHISIAFTNNNSAMPFSKFGSLFKAPLHAGFELGYGFNWRTKTKHDWVQEFKVGYFYHRFVQHGIPLYTELDYRYKFSQKIHANAGLGGGYFHSIPATAKMQLQSNGEYKNDKGVGRMQAMVAANIGFSYMPNPSAKRPVRIFSKYQQRIQTPFVKSYVPLLPYNSIQLGAGIPLKTKK